MGRRYAIIGTGALGGFYGGRLQQAGVETHFLLHRDFAHVRQKGLLVESPDGNFLLPQINAYGAVAQMPPCDVVVVALKTTQNHLLPQLLPPVVAPGGTVLILQNGLGVESAVAQIVPTARVVGGLCFLCSNKVGPGHIRHLDYGQIVLGEYQTGDRPAGKTDILTDIAQDLAAANIPTEIAPDLLLARWKKLIWNIPFNGLSVVLNARTDEMMAHPASRELAGQLMQEVAAGAAGYNRIIPSAFIQKMLDHTEKMTPYRPSMKLDFDAGRPLELAAMYGNPLQAAAAVGVAMPQVAMLHQQLQYLDWAKRRSP